jgi:hypothetical protein
MKFTWEPEDIQAGVVVSHRNEKGEHYILGYQGMSAGKENKRWVKVSLRDGMTSDRKTPHEMAEFLNTGNNVPVYLGGQVEDVLATRDPYPVRKS